ncbi:hypothetical protein C8Q75DRAFT_748022 [Abortiporus biennis]|nr:hypothetical protein C8Q75DRAFT_747991 [Abortiporus biennis]KAI0794913.1 hypothetical protein C8Q75DRAFT_748022 [Abortiporus biennis]
MPIYVDIQPNPLSLQCGRITRDAVFPHRYPLLTNLNFALSTSQHPITPSSRGLLNAHRTFCCCHAYRSTGLSIYSQKHGQGKYFCTSFAEYIMRNLWKTCPSPLCFCMRFEPAYKLNAKTGKTYHVEHFTCAVCPARFGATESYYEHNGAIYCHYHYSTRCARVCAGCGVEILKQFVEVDSEGDDAAGKWHPECYMIAKMWDIRIIPESPFVTPSSSIHMLGEYEAPYIEKEKKETPASIRAKQVAAQALIHRIWTILSFYEESTAACISRMLRYLGDVSTCGKAVMMAKKFILHIEVIFAALDDIRYSYTCLHIKGANFEVEAKRLCYDITRLLLLVVDKEQSSTMKQEEVTKTVTTMAHHLKLLIRAAFTGALELQQEHGLSDAVSSLLDRFHELAVYGAKSRANRNVPSSSRTLHPHDMSTAATDRHPSTRDMLYGYTSLTSGGIGAAFLVDVDDVNSPSDRCVACGRFVTEHCVRLGIFRRWHPNCAKCHYCGKTFTDLSLSSLQIRSSSPPQQNSTLFFDIDSATAPFSNFGPVPKVTLCHKHAHKNCRDGFQSVTTLEQYMFSLNIALRRMYVTLFNRGIVGSFVLKNPTSSVPSPILETDWEILSSGDIVGSEEYTTSSSS